MPSIQWLSRTVSPAAAARACLLLALALTAACEPTPGVVVFGLAGPLEDSYGRSMRSGAELAQQEINAAGGIGGRSLQFRALDDHASSEGAVRVAEVLFGDPEVVAVVGHVNSRAMIEAAAIYGRGLPALATSATSPAISRLGPWIFRVASSDSANAVALAHATASDGARIAVLYENDSYGRGLANSFRDAVVQEGGVLVESSPYLSTTDDFSPYLERMRQRGTETIFLAGVGETASRIIRQARRMGMTTRFIGGDGIEGLMGVDTLFDGTRVGLLFHPTQSARARSFSDAYRARHGHDPDSFAALGYDAVHLLARAAEEGGPSRSRIRAYLERIGLPDGHPPFHGATGTVRFDHNGDPHGKEFAIGTIRGSTIVLESDR